MLISENSGLATVKLTLKRTRKIDNTPQMDVVLDHLLHFGHGRYPQGSNKYNIAGRGITRIVQQFSRGEKMPVKCMAK